MSAHATLRSRVSRMLAAGDLEPPGLAPAAVLVVRSLADPLPRRLRPDARLARLPAEWERAARGALEVRLRGAAGPARGAVPAAAGAVYFADTAEMLACFADDAARGLLRARWWWAALRRDLPAGPMEAVTALWVREARYVPAALAGLHARGRAVALVAALAPAHAAEVLAATTSAWRLPAAGAIAPTRTGRAGEAGPDRPAPGPPGAEIGEPPPPPWETLLAPGIVPPGIAPARRALLGVALALHGDPLRARAAVSVAAIDGWLAAARRAPTVPAAPDGGASRPPALRGPSPDPITRPKAAGVAVPDGTTRRPPEPVAQGPAQAPPRPVPTEGRPSRRTAAPREPVPRGGPGVGDGAETASPATWDGGAEQLETAVGGVLFLVNVLRQLRFFDALDDHFGVAPAVGGWAWIELFGRALLGRGPAGLADDPLWRVLAALDGRGPAAPLGGGFGCERFDLPAHWAVPAAAGAGGGRGALLRGPPLDPALRRFLGAVVPSLRAWLASRLGAPDPADALLLRRGSVRATGAHVDLHLPLDAATAPVRIAGLDVDPGWVPELGRVVTFHYT